MALTLNGSARLIEQKIERGKMVIAREELGRRISSVSLSALEGKTARCLIMSQR